MIIMNNQTILVTKILTLQEWISNPFLCKCRHGTDIEWVVYLSRNTKINSHLDKLPKIQFYIVNLNDTIYNLLLCFVADISCLLFQSQNLIYNIITLVGTQSWTQIRCFILVFCLGFFIFSYHLWLIPCSR